MISVLVGQICQGGWTFAPRGFAACNGQQASIAQYQALFSLIGTTFGGNGVTTFALPDLRGRMMVGSGSGAGLTPRTLGQSWGTQSTQLLSSQLPLHVHGYNSAATLSASTADATLQQPQANDTAMLARSVDSSSAKKAIPVIYGPTTTTGTYTLGGLNVAGSLAPAGLGNAPMPTLPPLQCVQIVIALEGPYPARN